MSESGRLTMSFASRLWPAMPVLGAVILALGGNAAAACPETTKPWNSRIDAASHPAAALTQGCPLECGRRQLEVSGSSGREARAPLPLTLVTRAEDVADWHAGIFERLRGERFEERAARYCADTPPVPVRQL